MNYMENAVFCVCAFVLFSVFCGVCFCFYFFFFLGGGGCGHFKQKRNKT